LQHRLHRSIRQTAVDDDGGLQVKWPQRLCRVAAKQQRERSKQQNRILSFHRFKERGRLAHEFHSSAFGKALARI